MEPLHEERKNLWFQKRKWSKGQRDRTASVSKRKSLPNYNREQKMYCTKKEMSEGRKRYQVIIIIIWDWYCVCLIIHTWILRPQFQASKAAIDVVFFGLERIVPLPAVNKILTLLKKCALCDLEKTGWAGREGTLCPNSLCWKGCQDENLHCSAQNKKDPS